MSKQDFYRTKYATINENWKDSQTFYLDLIEQNINSKSILLNIGCGHSILLKDIYQKTKENYGIEPDVNSIQKNQIMQDIKQGYAHDLPFADNYFDIVVSTWVLEHIDQAQESMNEIYRVLKPGGKFIFLTPNKNNYVVMMIRLIPDCLHDFLNRKLYNRQEGDTFPVRYKMNTQKEIKALASKAGFRKTDIFFNGDPSYISFNIVLFYIAVLFEKILSISFLQKYRVHLIGCLKK